MRRASPRGASVGGNGCHITRRTRQNPGDDESEKENPTTCRKQRPTKRGRPTAAPLAANGAGVAAATVAAAAPPAAPASSPPPPPPLTEVTVTLPTRGRLLELALFEWLCCVIKDNNGNVPRFDALKAALPAEMVRDGVTARHAHDEATYFRTDLSGTEKRRRELAAWRSALAGLPLFALRGDEKLIVYYAQSTGLPVQASSNQGTARDTEEKAAALMARDAAITAREAAVAPLAGVRDKFGTLTKSDMYNASCALSDESQIYLTEIFQIMPTASQSAMPRVLTLAFRAVLHELGFARAVQNSPTTLEKVEVELASYRIAAATAEHARKNVALAATLNRPDILAAWQNELVKCEAVFGEKHAALVAAKERVGSDACDRVATTLAPSNPSVRRYQTTVRVTATLTLKCRL